MNIPALLAVVALQAAAPAATPDVDAVFAEWSTNTPGCSVGAEADGELVVSRGFGMADLERDSPNRADTIFEAGSVSKQFTAAAVLLLERDGKLRLDDPIRKYVPELPEDGEPITIRQMLTHTSGLRDWGSVAGIAGWPRTTRAYTHAHVLDILSRQRALNFAPGTRWSYSNSGYNLAAILVARTSGMSFAEFTRRRIFEPLGMSDTSWRDDHTRVVPRRALAYERQSGGYRLDMPFENVHGNGGLLTTVGDLLTWSRNFRTPRVGDAAFVKAQITPGRFADGREHDYGLGVWVGGYRGLREIRHSGSTAGYRAYLTVFPDRRAAVAVLCNAGNARAADLAYRVTDLVLAASLAPEATPRAGYTLTAPERDAVMGLYRTAGTGVPVRVVADDAAGVRIDRGATLRAESGTSFVASTGERWVFEPSGGVRVTDPFGTVETLTKTEPWTPSTADLAAMSGTFVSADAETSFEARTEGGRLVLAQRPDRLIPLTPTYKDGFEGALGAVIFHRDGLNKVTAFSLSQQRVWDLRFERQDAAQTSQLR